jgi:NAD-dependent SIR2 family protein deacetylase
MRNYDDLEGELLTDTCRQCQRAFRSREEVPDGPPVCDDCYRRTMEREFEKCGRPLVEAARKSS